MYTMAIQNQVGQTWGQLLVRKSGGRAHRCSPELCFGAVVVQGTAQVIPGLVRPQPTL